MQKNKNGFYLTHKILYTEINLKSTKYLNLKPETINREKKLHDIGFGDDFLVITPNAKAIKAKLGK